MKVLKHGKFYFDKIPNTIECSNCECVFQFEEKDCFTTSHPFLDFPLDTIACPECGCQFIIGDGL